MKTNNLTSTFKTPKAGWIRWELAGGIVRRNGFVCFRGTSSEAYNFYLKVRREHKHNDGVVEVSRR